MLLNEAGKFRAKVLQSNTYITMAGTGTFQIVIPLEIIEGPQAGSEITGILNLTDNSEEKSAKTLAEAFGYGGDLEDLYNGECPFVGAECQIVTEFEIYKGEQKCKVKWINKPGAGFKPAEKSAFESMRAQRGAKFRRVAAETLNKTGATTTAASAYAPPAAQSQAAQSGGVRHDDNQDLPF